jgi:capsid protein
LVESQQVKSPDDSEEFESGIKYDEWGRPVAYSIEQSNGEFKILPATSVIHIFNAERATSTRGISTFYHLLSLTNQRTELLDLTIQKARQEAKFVNAIEQTKSDDALSSQDYLNGCSSADDEAKEEERLLYESANRVSSVIGGTTVSLPHGMTLKQLSNNTPGSSYLGFAEQLLKLSSTGLMPYGFADPSGLTGVSVRMVIAKAARVIAARQDIICEAMTKIYQYWIGCEIANGGITTSEELTTIFNVEWQCPRTVTVDYGRDEKTDLQLVQSGLKPIEDYYAERGLEFK